MKNASQLTISTFGIVTGVAGLEHGLGEILQGSVAPEGIFILSWQGSELFYILGQEPAMTIVPNLLATGVLAMLFSAIFIAWATRFVERPAAGPVLILLSVVMLLFGAGFGPPLLGVILGAAAWKHRLPLAGGRTPRTAARQPVIGQLWPWFFGASLLAWLFLFPGSILLSYFVALNDTFLIPVVTFFAIGTLLLTIRAGFARDNMELSQKHLLG